MSTTERLQICHACQFRARPCVGSCACTVDKRDIINHARAGQCPKGYFTACALTPPPVAVSQDCPHRGALTGEAVPCVTCGGNVRIKLLACEKFGTCTERTPVKGVACCATCALNPKQSKPVPCAPPADGPVDAVFVLGTGSTDDNLELRFALRSLEQFAPWVRKVWVVGSDPGFLSPVVGFLPAPDSYPCKDANIIGKLLTAARQPDLAEQFLFCSDDQLLLQPATPEDFAPRFLSTYVPDKPLGDTPWHACLAETLRQFGPGAKYFQPHIWAPMTKARVIDMATRRRWKDTTACIVMSLYYNHCGEPGVPNFDHEYGFNARQMDRVRHLGYSAGAFANHQFRAELTRRFPLCSHFEA